jgi:phosphate transport system permease protein
MASVAIVVLILIMIFLLQDGAGFLSTYRWSLDVYRKSGMELCDLVEQPVRRMQEESASLMRQMLAHELAVVSGTAKARRDAAAVLVGKVQAMTAPERAALESALLTAAAPEILDDLRGRLRQAAEKTARVIPMPPVLTPGEAEQLRRELAALSPELAAPLPLQQVLDAEHQRMDAEARVRLAPLVAAVQACEQAPEPLYEALAPLRKQSGKVKEAAMKHRMDAARPEPPFEEHLRSLLAARPMLLARLDDYAARVKQVQAALPAETHSTVAGGLLAEVREALTGDQAALADVRLKVAEWEGMRTVSMIRAALAFCFGAHWTTNSPWQDFYGIVPLLAGSVLISLLAILIATPLSVAAAVYTSQFASEREKQVVKPVIEFIQAIPSIVLGFIGIAILGDLIKSVSHWPLLSWLPGFPIEERLNMFNAGCLLAFMAVPTMFSLAEDALNNVPQGYAAASEALGATKLQTVFRVIVPAASSGILAAILLGLGRVIGETMVVLLVAGNRIAVPDFGDGLGVVFQPAHTLTGIIAQELGEVSRGSIHWQALFMVGIVLFLISLVVNWCARAFAKRLETPKA